MSCPLCGHPHGHIVNCELDGATTDKFIEVIRRISLERNQARYDARILAHAYEHDNRPPDDVIARAQSYDRDQRLPVFACPHCGSTLGVTLKPESTTVGTNYVAICNNCNRSIPTMQCGVDRSI